MSHPNLGQQFTLLGIPVVVRQFGEEDFGLECRNCVFKDNRLTPSIPFPCSLCDAGHETLPSCTKFGGTYYEAVQDVDSK